MTKKYKSSGQLMSKSDDTIFQKQGNSLKNSIVFYSEVDISDKSIPRRDEKIISLMIKRFLGRPQKKE